MRTFKSSESFPIKGRGISYVIQPWDLDGLTFGELESIIKNQTFVMINDRLERIMGYEYFAICRKDSDLITFPVGFQVKR